MPAAGVSGTTRVAGFHWTRHCAARGEQGTGHGHKTAVCAAAEAAVEGPWTHTDVPVSTAASKAFPHASTHTHSCSPLQPVCQHTAGAHALGYAHVMFQRLRMTPDRICTSTGLTELDTTRMSTCAAAAVGAAEHSAALLSATTNGTLCSLTPYPLTSNYSATWPAAYGLQVIACWPGVCCCCC